MSRFHASSNMMMIMKVGVCATPLVVHHLSAFSDLLEPAMSGDFSLASNPATCLRDGNAHRAQRASRRRSSTLVVVVDVKLQMIAPRHRQPARSLALRRFALRGPDGDGDDDDDDGGGGGGDGGGRQVCRTTASGQSPERCDAT